MKLVFATHNPHKFKEISRLMPQQYKLLSLDDIGCKEDIPETGATLEANALIKANYVFEQYGYPCFADDTGLLIDALNGEPGVLSARYAGDQKDSRDNIEKVLTKLKGHQNRKARFETVIALKLNTNTKIFKGEVKGVILSEIKGTEGFGYDHIFQPEAYQSTFAEMTLELKNKISHRARALKQLTDYLTELN